MTLCARLFTLYLGKISIALLLIVLLTSCTAIYSSETPSPRATIGDQPTYIKVNDCPKWARSAIGSKNLPLGRIHSCKEEQIKLDTGESVILITIQYGEAMDCPSGCIYSRYFGVYVDENKQLVDLPDVAIELAMWGRPPFNEWRTWWTENHSSKSRQTIAKRNGYYGWILLLDHYKLTLLYWKSYGANAQLGKRLYVASGEIFVYFNESGNETWDYSRFKTKTEDIQ